MGPSGTLFWVASGGSGVAPPPGTDWVVRRVVVGAVVGGRPGGEVVGGSLSWCCGACWPGVVVSGAGWPAGVGLAGGLATWRIDGWQVVLPGWLGRRGVMGRSWTGLTPAGVVGLWLSGAVLHSVSDGVQGGFGGGFEGSVAWILLGCTGELQPRGWPWVVGWWWPDLGVYPALCASLCVWLCSVLGSASYPGGGGWVVQEGKWRCGESAGPCPGKGV